METLRSEEEKIFQTTVNATSRYESTYTPLNNNFKLNTSSRYILSNPIERELYANNVIEFSFIKVEHGIEIIIAEGEITIYNSDQLTDKQQDKYKKKFENAGRNQGEYSFAGYTVSFNAKFNEEYTEGVLYAEQLNGETIYGTITYTEEVSFEVGEYLSSLEKTMEKGEYTYSITIPPKLEIETKPEKLTPIGDDGDLTHNSSDFSSKSNWEYELEYENLEIGLFSGTKTKLFPEEVHTVFMQVPLAGVEFWYGTWNGFFILYGGFTVNNIPTTLIIKSHKDFLDEYKQYISDFIIGIDHKKTSLNSTDDVLKYIFIKNQGGYLGD